MVHHAQHAARLERLVDGAQRAFGLVALHPVVQVAEGEDEVGAARRGDVVPVGVELRHQDLAVQLGLSLQAREQLLVVGEVLRRRSRVAARGDVEAFVLQERRQDLHVVARAAGEDFHHHAVFPDAEEGERAEGVAVGVTRDVGGRAVRSREEAVREKGTVALHLRRGAGEECEGEERREQSHLSPPLPLSPPPRPSAAPARPESPSGSPRRTGARARPPAHCRKRRPSGSSGGSTGRGN